MKHQSGITSVSNVAQNVSKSTEKMGEQDVWVAPPIILLGEHLLPLCSKASDASAALKNLCYGANI